MTSATVRIGETNTYTLTLRNIGDRPDQISDGRLESPSRLEPIDISGSTTSFTNPDKLRSRTTNPVIRAN